MASVGVVFEFAGKARLTPWLICTLACGGACGDNDRLLQPEDAGTDAPANVDAPAEVDAPCAHDSECPDFMKCNRYGACVSMSWCETDDDCPPTLPGCLAYPGCSICSSNAHCPADLPFCVSGWEGGSFCAECVVGDFAAACPDGTWCTPVSVWGEIGGNCRSADCSAEPSSMPCVACKFENSAPCFDAGSECHDEHQAFCDCLDAAGFTCPSPVTEKSVNPAIPSCFDAADALEACVLGCAAAASPCHPAKAGKLDRAVQ